ncbi:MAG: hypothetical protein IT453_03175 [Planctomycetes bacterium]|nr:hypothetical protein [Planctomycetota bacterium]
MLSLVTRAALLGDLDGADTWGTPDGRVLGTSLAILGLFLVANAILLRSSRSLIEERFGGRRMKLRSIRELVFQRVQMTLGFGFLIVGFGAELYGAINPPPPDAPPTSVSLWIGLVVFLGVVSELGAWWFSLHSFRRQLRRWFRENPPEFETDMALAREVGEVFGVESSGEDTVESFCARVREELELPAKPAFVRAAPREYDRSGDEGEEPLVR